ADRRQTTPLVRSNRSLSSPWKCGSGYTETTRAQPRNLLLRLHDLHFVHVARVCGSYNLDQLQHTSSSVVRVARVVHHRSVKLVITIATRSSGGLHARWR